MHSYPHRPAYVCTCTDHVGGDCTDLGVYIHICLDVQMYIYMYVDRS